MKSTLLLCAFLLSVNTYAQVAKGTPQKANEIKNGTLTVLKYKNAPSYNTYIEEILTERWDGKFIMMEYAEYKAMKKFEGPLLALGTGMSPTFFGASMSLKYGADFYVEIQVNYPQPTRTTVDSVSKRFNKYSKEHVNLLFSLLLNAYNDIKSGSAGSELKLDITGKSTREYYQDATTPAKLKQGILYISKNELTLKKPNGSKMDTGLLQPGVIEGLYKGKFKLVTEAELAEVIAKKEPNTYYMLAFTEGSVGLYSIVDLEKEKIAYLDFARGAYGDVTVWTGMLKDLNKLIGY